MKKKRSSGGGANWMDTYGDMVTLLLCFFVLLYSMSTLDQQKWLEVVQSFNPDAIQEITDTKGNSGPNAEVVTGAENTDGGGGSEMTQEQVNEKIEQIAAALQEYVKQQSSTENISVVSGTGYVFVSFNDAIFFEPNSFILRDDGKVALDGITGILTESADTIDEIRILGHTAQASPGQLNDATIDRMLSSNRAISVLVYLQDKNFIDPGRLVSVGYGQWRPIADNEDSTEKIRNRRVEMIITGINVEDESKNALAQYYTEANVPQPTTEPAVSSTAPAAPSDAVASSAPMVEPAASAAP